MQIVDGAPYLDQVKDLIIEYMNRIGRALSFRHPDEELGTVPSGDSPL